MQSLETQCAVQVCTGVRNERGEDQKRRPLSTRGAAVWGRPLAGKMGGVHNVHTLGFGSGRTGAGLGRIAKVSGGVAEIQELEPGSSPTSGTVISQFRGLFGGFSCAHCAHSRL